MSRFSLFRGFSDPVTRPRYIVWFAVAICSLALFVIFGGILGTSTIWFCSAPCHKVQGDTIASYHASSHAKISCMACHEPVNANPVVLLLAKAKSAGEVPPTVTNTFELPLNKLSGYALNAKEMGSKQCTQCHTTKRDITTNPDIIIKHDVHEKEGVTCTTCHNRIAHNEKAITLALPGNSMHEDFMEMDACFRCHDVEGKRRARGACSLCHPKDFNLVPESHEEAGWLPSGHSAEARESLTRFGEKKIEAEELVKEGAPEDVAVAVEHCSTCHRRTFCSGCHAKLAAAFAASEPKTAEKKD